MSLIQNNSVNNGNVTSFQAICDEATHAGGEVQSMKQALKKKNWWSFVFTKWNASNGTNTLGNSQTGMTSM